MFHSIPTPLHSNQSISALTEDFLHHIRYELGFSPQSVEKYAECLKKIAAHCGDKPAIQFSKVDLFELRRSLVERKLSVSRQLSILLSLRRFLRYLAEDRDLIVLDPELIKVPKRPRKEVVYLTIEEIDRFLAVIPQHTLSGEVYMRGLRFRALVEVLLGTAMRIGEALSIKTLDIDFKTAEAKIIGKGRKERTVFFTDRSLSAYTQNMGVQLNLVKSIFAPLQKS